jgi:predicted CoA-binding protein
MNDLISMLDDPGTTIAVVGASDNPSKYGSIIYRDMKRKGYRVYAVNPNRETVDGDASFPDLESLPAPPDIIDLVVPAWTGIRVAREALALGHMGVWVQPGADSPQLIDFLQQNGFDYLADACIMVESRRMKR